MLIAWTTVATSEDADRLARGAVDQGMAVCVQIDGPLTSVYRWQGAVETAAEYRLCFKLTPTQRAPLEVWIHNHHPYEIPEWLVFEAGHVGEKYLSWALANSSSRPF